MTIKADTIVALDVKSHKGIQGGVAITNIQDGNAIEIENMTMGSQGLLIKRPGYNLYGCELPIRLKKLSDAGDAIFYSTPVVNVSMKLHVFENINQKFPNLGYYSMLQSDKKNHVLCELNYSGADYEHTMPEEVTITTSSLLELADGTIVSPTHVFNDRIFALPLAVVTTAKVGITLAAFNIAGSYVVPDAYIPVLHEGPQLRATPEGLIVNLEVVSPTRARLELSGPAEYLEVGTPIFFENCIYGEGNVFLQGRVYSIATSEVVVDILNTTIDSVAFPTGLLVSSAYCRIRFCEKHRLQAKYLSGWKNATTGATTTEKLVVTGVNSLRHASLSVTTSEWGSAHLYGSGISCGRVNTLNQLYHTYESSTDIVCGYNGFLFKEEKRATPIELINGLPINVSVLTTLKVNGAGYIVIPVVDANTVYAVADKVYVQAVQQNGNVLVSELVVYSVSATGITVVADGVKYLTVYPNSLLDFRRISTRIYLKLGQALIASPLCCGVSVQYPPFGDIGPHNVLLDVYSDGVSDWIELDDAIEWTSGNVINALEYFTPILQTAANTVDVRPLTSAYLQGGIDTFSTMFDNALYIATGRNGIYRYDGEQLSGFGLPIPPTAHVRSVPGSSGFLETTETDAKKRVGKDVQIFLTYSYEDSLGRVFESGVTPDLDITGYPGAAQDASGFSEVLEVQVPSIPRDIGLPADKIKINAYRFMTTKLEGTSFAPVLEVSVPNNPDLPFTILRVGANYVPSISGRQKLYTYDPVGGSDSNLYRESNRPAPISNVLTTSANRVVALNGSESPFFELIGKKVYDSDVGNLFGAYLKLAYRPIDIGATYEFYTIPFGMDAGTPVVEPTNFPAAFPKGRAHKIQAAAAVTKTVTAITLADASHTFSIMLDTATDYTAELTGVLYKLRTTGTADLSLLPIQFNTQVFKKTAAYSATTDKLQLKADARWTDTSDIVAGVPSNLKDTRFLAFKSAFAAPLDLPCTATGDLGLMFVSVGGETIRLYIKTTSPAYVLNQFSGKCLVIHGPGTLGNIVRTGQSRQLSWDTDLLFYSASNEQTDAGVAGFVYYKLVPKDLAVDPADVTKYVLKDFPYTADAAGIVASQKNYSLQIFEAITDAAHKLGSIGDMSRPSTSMLLTLNNNTGLLPGNYLNLSLDGSTVKMPSGFPEAMDCSLKIISLVGGTQVNVKIIPSDTLLETSPTVLSTALGVNTAVDTAATAALAGGTLTLTLEAGANLTGVRVDDYVYVAYRGVNENTLAMQFSGWFKVTAKGTDTVTVAYAAAASNPLDPSALSSTRLAYMLTIDNSVAGVIKVPVPVPYKLDYIDIAAPHFDQVPGTRVTPLALVMKRLALALNQVLPKVGFAYWGGSLGSLTYPVNGFRFLSHNYPINRYRGYSKVAGSWIYTKPNIPRSSYEIPFDTWQVSAIAGYYALNSSVFNETTGGFTNEVIDVTTVARPVATFTVREDRYPSRLWYTDAVSQNIIRSARIPAFNYKNYLDINSGDGEGIIGACPYQDTLLVFKSNSLWRINWDENGFPSSSRVQTPVGLAAPKSVVAFQGGVYFVHNSGVYLTDGVTAESVTELNTYFSERVVQNQELLSYGAGHLDPISKEVFLGVPYSDNSSEYVSQADSQFVFNYNANVMGWSVNRNINAVWWTRVLNKDYFASEGAVYRTRYEQGNTKYRDYRGAITSKLVTRYVDESSANRFKFWRNVVFQFGNAADTTFKIYAAADYLQDYATLPVIAITSSKYGSSPYGGKFYGTDKRLTAVRRGVSPCRCAQLSFKIVDDTLDSPGAIYSVALEGQITNSRLVNQQL